MGNDVACMAGVSWQHKLVLTISTGDEIMKSEHGMSGCMEYTCDTILTKKEHHM